MYQPANGPDSPHTPERLPAQAIQIEEATPTILLTPLTPYSPSPSPTKVSTYLIKWIFKEQRTGDLQDLDFFELLAKRYIADRYNNGGLWNVTSNTKESVEMVAREMDEDEEQREPTLSKQINIKSLQSRLGPVIDVPFAKRLRIFYARTHSVFPNGERRRMGSLSHPIPSVYHT